MCTIGIAVNMLRKFELHRPVHPFQLAWRVCSALRGLVQSLVWSCFNRLADWTAAPRCFRWEINYEITQGLDHGDASSSFGIGHCQLCVTSNHGPSWAIMGHHGPSWAIMGHHGQMQGLVLLLSQRGHGHASWWQSSVRVPCFKREYTACIFVGPCCLESGRQFPISSWFGDFLPRTCATIDWLTILRLRLHQNRSCLELLRPI